MGFNPVFKELRRMLEERCRSTYS